MYFNPGALPPLVTHIHWTEASKAKLLSQVFWHVEAANTWLRELRDPTSLLSARIPGVLTLWGNRYRELILKSWDCWIGDSDLLLETTSHFIPFYWPNQDQMGYWCGESNAHSLAWGKHSVWKCFMSTWIFLPGSRSAAPGDGNSSFSKKQEWLLSS